MGRFAKTPSCYAFPRIGGLAESVEEVLRHADLSQIWLKWLEIVKSSHFFLPLLPLKV
jgi:hypothetical protein